MSKQNTSTPQNQQDDKMIKDLSYVEAHSKTSENEAPTSEISEEELENIREELRNKYNRLLGCGG